MKVDVSEIKTFKACKRKWKLTSRNCFHLAPRVTPKAFHMGTLFHESLHKLYLGVDIKKVMEDVREDMTSDEAALLAMIPNYAEKVLEDDLERFEVLDIEHKFEFTPTDREGKPFIKDLTICGSIDMICVEKATNKIYGFEHKTAKNFRDPTFLWMDEQPRVYTVALCEYIDKLNEKIYKDWVNAINDISIADLENGVTSILEVPKYYTLGGIYINEVRKLFRSFDYQRTLCEYPKDDLQNFMQSFFSTCAECKQAVDTDDVAAPEPSYWNCQLCDFSGVCQTYMYSTLNKEEVIQEFEEELMVREKDHLEEK